MAKILSASGKVNIAQFRCVGIWYMVVCVESKMRTKKMLPVLRRRVVVDLWMEVHWIHMVCGYPSKGYNP